MKKNKEFEKPFVNGEIVTVLGREVVIESLRPNSDDWETATWAVCVWFSVDGMKQEDNFSLTSLRHLD